jgi:hypothetical protein
MGHLRTIESELRQVIAEGDKEALVVWVKERILESYRNGQAVLRSSGSPRSGTAASTVKQPRSPAPSNLPI